LKTEERRLGKERRESFVPKVHAAGGSREGARAGGSLGPQSDSS
jgi:hypothetical protein